MESCLLLRSMSIASTLVLVSVKSLLVFAKVWVVPVHHEMFKVPFDPFLYFKTFTEYYQANIVNFHIRVG